jgi:uracil phosphoribosyltransferase
MGKVFIAEHNLISHKIALLRDVNTGSKKFRELLHEITIIIGCYATSDLPVEEITVKTPLTETRGKCLSGREIAIIPIMRAGIGMVDGMLTLLPTAKVGHVGLARDHETLLPKEYYCNLPNDIAERQVIITDPMLATGGSAGATIQLLKDKGVSDIKLISIIASPEGIKYISEAHPDVDVYCGVLDEYLNENGYIVPGLGDAGDRLFGTL